MKVVVFTVVWIDADTAVYTVVRVVCADTAVFTVVWVVCADTAVFTVVRVAFGMLKSDHVTVPTAKTSRLLLRNTTDPGPVPAPSPVGWRTNPLPTRPSRGS